MRLCIGVELVSIECMCVLCDYLLLYNNNMHHIWVCGCSCIQDMREHVCSVCICGEFVHNYTYT